MMKYEHSILLVDDEASILKALVRLLRKTPYTVLTAPSGQEALELISETEKPFSLIISDQRMPEMTGAEFLGKSKDMLPYAIRFLLTGYSEIDSIVEAINKGQIHRFIHKPWNDNDLLLTIEQGIQQYELVLENKRLMAVAQKQNAQLMHISKSLDAKVKKRTDELNEKTRELEESFFHIIRSFSALADSFSPDDAGHGRRVSALASQIARHMGIKGENLRNTEIAALLHDIGKIGLPRNLSAPFLKSMTQEEKNIYRKHSSDGYNILKFIPRLETASFYIKHHHENFDGSGFPEGLKEESIPLASRIIAVADAYDKIACSPESNKNPILIEYERTNVESMPDHIDHSKTAQQAAIYYLKQNIFSAFDPDIIKILLEVLKTYGLTFKNEKELTLKKLEDGMVLTRPLYTERGRFLLPYDTILTSSIIEKLKSLHEEDLIQEPIYILSTHDKSKK